MTTSLTHEGFVLLFTQRPLLAAELLRDALGVPLPTFSEARLASADLTQLQPVERRADVVVELADDEGPKLGVIVEVQLQPDAAKVFVWPTYLVALHARLRCPVCLLVVAPTDELAASFARPLSLGPNMTVTPFALGPSRVPVVIDPEEAARDPELAVLSALAHGRDDTFGKQVAEAAFHGLRGFDEDRRLEYLDLVLHALSSAARAALEDLMANGGYQFTNEWFQKGRAEGVAEGVAVGRAEGVAVGRAEGVAEGVAVGAAAGRAEGVARALLMLLEARGVGVSPERRAEILATADETVLLRWFEQAAAGKLELP